MSEPSVILIAHDSRGLGSFRRQCNIAAALHQQSPGVALFLASSSELPTPSYLTLLPLPGCAETQARSRLLLAYAQQRRPRALLVDKHPLGVRTDFEPTLRWANEQGIPCFYGLRDILDHPERVRAEWQDVLPCIARCFRKVLVYGQRELFDVTQYGLDPGQIEYCGYVSLATAVHKAQNAILCTVGGGDSGLAAQLSRLFWDCELTEHKTLVSGPLNNVAVQAKPRHQHIVYCPDMPKMWATHHTVVCLGGYNTLIEALYYGLNVICVPRIDPRLEQLVRAQVFANRGWIQYIHPEQLTTDALQTAVSHRLRPRDQPAFTGAQRAADTILHEISLHSEMVS